MPRNRKAQEGEDIIQNAIKTVLANIRFTSVDDPISTIVVTSSIPNEGKSTISVNLAQAIASSGRSVLLVECDMRRRTLAGRLGVHPANGLYAVLSGRVPLSEAVVATPTPRMFFLDAEPHIPNPADILASKRFHRFVQDADASYDYVIFDTPPVGPFVDAAVASAVVDGTILVVRDRFVKRADLLNAFEQLQKAGANVIGTVLNGTQHRENDYYYNYYKKDKRDGSFDDDAPEMPMEPVEAPMPAAQPAPVRPAAPAARAGVRAPQAARPVQPANARRQQAAAPAAAAQAQAPGQAPVARPGSRVSPGSTAAMINQFRNSRH